ncbi:MAG: hypothetical protein WBA44_05235 [Mesorhizobium sp.]
MEDGRNEWDLPEIGLRRLGAQDIQLFWKRYAAVHGPGLSHGSLYSRWREVGESIVISLYLTKNSVGLFVRGRRGESFVTTARRLSAYEPELGTALGASLHGEYPLCYLTGRSTVTTDTRAWPAAFDWMLAAERRYEAVLLETVTDLGPEL